MGSEASRRAVSMATTSDPKTDRPRIILDGADAEAVDMAALPNWALKELLRGGGTDAAWDEAVDRVWRKAERGDYGEPDEQPDEEGGESTQ